MQKASLNPDLAKQGGGGVEAGKYRVKSAKTQNIKTEYRPNQLYGVLELIQLDASWQPVREAEEQELRLSFGQESLKHYRPAKANGPDDADPVDQGDAPDAEGNTVGVMDSEPFNKSTAALVFFESLAKHGFSKEKLNQCYFPMFVGMEFELASYSPKECNEKFNTRLNTKPVKDREDPTKTVDITYKVATAWHNPNYLGAAQSNTAQTAAAPVQATASPSESAEDLAVKTIKVIVVRKSGTDVKTPAAMQGFANNAYAQKKIGPMEKLKDVQSLVKDGAFLARAFDRLGFSVAYNEDNGNPEPFTFPVPIPTAPDRWVEELKGNDPVRI